MPKKIQTKGLMRKNKMILSAVRQFLEKGYEKTTTSAIAQAAGFTPSAFFASFENKEELLLILVEKMYSDQFYRAEGMLEGNKDPLMIYAVETALQLHIAELSEALREIYTMAYSLPKTSEYIYKATADKLRYIFADYLPEAEPKDFYEMEIASAGITRGFMAKKCDFYFTMEHKLTRFLSCCFTLYRVPDEVQKQVIEKVLQMELKPVAEKLVWDTVEKAEAGFEAMMAR